MKQIILLSGNIHLYDMVKRMNAICGIATLVTVPNSPVVHTYASMNMVHTCTPNQANKQAYARLQEDYSLHPPPSSK